MFDLAKRRTISRKETNNYEGISFSIAFDAKSVSSY